MIAAVGHVELVATTQLMQAHQRRRYKRIGGLGQVAELGATQEATITRGVEPAGHGAFDRHGGRWDPLNPAIRRRDRRAGGTALTPEPVATATAVATEATIVVVKALGTIPTLRRGTFRGHRTLGTLGALRAIEALVAPPIAATATATALAAVIEAPLTAAVGSLATLGRWIHAIEGAIVAIAPLELIA